MLNIQTAEQILADSKKLLIGMKKYKRIMDSLYWTDVSADKDFQRAFNDFFVMRSRKSPYYDRFYLFLEQKKHKGATFEETLDYLKEAGGQLELSFSSKLIHVINPNRPIWDKIVAENHFKMKLPGYGGDTSLRQKEIVKLYHEYCSRFYEFLDSADGQVIVSERDSRKSGRFQDVFIRQSVKRQCKRNLLPRIGKGASGAEFHLNAAE